MKKVLSFILCIIIFGCSSDSDQGNNNSAETIPLAPTDLQYSITTEVKSPYKSATINLSWKDNSTNEKRSVVEYRKAGETKWNPLQINITSQSNNSISAQITTYSYANGLNFYSQDEYRVYSENSAGKSGYSNVIKIEEIKFPDGKCTKCIKGN